MPHLLAGHLASVGMPEALDPHADHLPFPPRLGAEWLEVRAHRPSPSITPGASSTSAIATSSIPSSASTLTRSSGWWLRSVPLARLVQANPAACSALASEPPPVSMCLGSYPHPPSARSASTTCGARGRVRYPLNIRATLTSRSHSSTFAASCT